LGKNFRLIGRLPSWGRKTILWPGEGFRGPDGIFPGRGAFRGQTADRSGAGGHGAGKIQGRVAGNGGVAKGWGTGDKFRKGDFLGLGRATLGLCDLHSRGGDGLDPGPFGFPFRGQTAPPLGIRERGERSHSGGRAELEPIEITEKKWILGGRVFPLGGPKTAKAGRGRFWVPAKNHGSKNKQTKKGF